MSGSSAMASARRRRAGNVETPIQSNQSNQNSSQNNVQDSNLVATSNQRMTPLQILKIHDDKLKILEESINKINLLDLTNNKVNSNENHTNNNTNNNTINNNKLNEIKFEQLNSQIIHLSEIVKSLQINIENISKLNIIENDQYKIINDGILEINNLKNLVLDTQKNIIDIKNDISLTKSSYEKHDTILQNLNFENTNNDAEMLFKSVLEEQMNGNFSFDKIIINHDDDEEIDDKDNAVNIVNLNFNNDELKNNNLERGIF